MKSQILSIFLCLFSSISIAGTVDPNTPQDKYIEYGKKYKCVLRLCGKDSDGISFCASAVLIKPRWFLTAAHVVRKSKSCTLNINEEKICVEKIYCHDKFNDDVFGYNDIALGYINQNIDIDYYPELYSSKDEVGKLCAMSGYGLTGTFLTGAVVSDNKKRAGSNHIEYIDRQLLICNASKRSEKFTELEFLIASGDSGGGLFIDGKLAGINSCVLATDKKPDSTYKDESGHTRISDHYDWINSVIKENNQNEK